MFERVRSCVNIYPMFPCCMCVSQEYLCAGCVPHVPRVTASIPHAHPRTPAVCMCRREWAACNVYLHASESKKCLGPERGQQSLQPQDPEVFSSPPKAAADHGEHPSPQKPYATSLVYQIILIRLYLNFMSSYPKA